MDGVQVKEKEKKSLSCFDVLHKVMLHGTLLDDEFWRNTVALKVDALQHGCVDGFLRIFAMQVFEPASRTCNANHGFCSSSFVQHTCCQCFA